RERITVLDERSIDLRHFIPHATDGKISKATFLKPYVGPLEKGIIFISFEDQWARLLHARNLAEFAKKYTLIVSPTWCPPHSLVNGLFPAVYPGTIFTL